MKLNAGPLDRSVRIVIGIVPLFTGIFGYCPLYQLFGWSTCPVGGYKR